MIKKPACKIAILTKFWDELYFDEELSSHSETLCCIDRTHEQLHIARKYL